MKIKTWIKYEESYLPPRCRKLRYRECEDYVNVNLKEVAPEETKLAFEDKSYSGKGKIYYYKRKLWSKVKLGHFMCYPEEHGIKTPLEELKYVNENCSIYFPRGWRDGEHPDKKRMLTAAREAIKNYVLIDGELYEQTAEPRYCINTFGLGHNHGGTGLFVDYHYNPNIRKDNYFSALDGDAAVEYANNVAARRGDTNDVGKFEKMIVVHMPELVKVKPKKQHGNGNKILNDMNDIVESVNDPFLAGLLCLSYTAHNS